MSKTSPRVGQFLSSIFLVPKPDGSSRFILNLKAWNRFLRRPHFKLEDYIGLSLNYYIQIVFTSLDIKDAYFLVSVDKKFRKYLTFSFKDSYYSFNCSICVSICVHKDYEACSKIFKV